MIHLKPGVRINILSPQAVLGMMIVASVFDEYDETLTITSICEGKHSPRSKHYLGCAFDTRLPAKGNIPFLELCQNRLGDDWDCLFEGDHFHFEWDPEGQPI